jgi:hypothetical protein
MHVIKRKKSLKSKCGSLDNIYVFFFFAALQRGFLFSEYRSTHH